MREPSAETSLAQLLLRPGSVPKGLIPAPADQRNARSRNSGTGGLLTPIVTAPSSDTPVALLWLCPVSTPRSTAPVWLDQRNAWPARRPTTTPPSPETSNASASTPSATMPVCGVHRIAWQQASYTPPSLSSSGKTRTLVPTTSDPSAETACASLRPSPGRVPRLMLPVSAVHRYA